MPNNQQPHQDILLSETTIALIALFSETTIALIALSNGISPSIDTSVTQANPEDPAPNGRVIADILRQQICDNSDLQRRPPHRVPYRYRTGRTVQFNTHNMPSAFDRLYQIAE